MSTVGTIQPTTEITTLPASQQAHAHQTTQSTSTEDVHYIAQSFDERDWDAVMVLYHAGASLVRQRERERRERKQVQRDISNMEVGEAGRLQLATNNLIVKLRLPRKARSCKKRAAAKSKLVSTLPVPVLTSVARRTRSSSSQNPVPL